MGVRRTKKIVADGTSKGGHSSEGHLADNAHKPIAKEGNSLGGWPSNHLHRDALCSGERFFVFVCRVFVVRSYLNGKNHR